MNPVIKRELEKVRIPLPEYDDNTTTLHIPKQGSETEAVTHTIERSHHYLIQVADYVLNEPPNFTLSSNWNQGIKPVSKFLKVQIDNIMGKMLQVSGCGYDWQTQTARTDIYSGLWLPLASIGVIQEI